jgi:hypothetical protein
MPILRLITLMPVLSLFLVAACGGGGGSAAPAAGGSDPPPAATGALTLALTDGPMQAVQELTVHVASLELHHADGRAVRVEPVGGPAAIDVAALQNGQMHDLLDRAEVPAGHYRGVDIVIDPDRSHVAFADGSQHPMTFAWPDGIRVDAPFDVGPGAHAEYVIDFDLRQGLQMHHGAGGHMGGGMGDYYELHSATRMIDTSTAGGLVGAVDASLVNINNAACDSALGQNQAYLLPASATEPDDIAEVETDGRPGPLVTDRVELHPGVGEYRYHFAFLAAGSYRVAFTCAGEWDESSDDDYPSDPDGRFGFQAFSEPVDVIAGEVTVLDIGS